MNTAIKAVAHIGFWVIVGYGLLVSGNAVFEVLTSSVGVVTWIALGAAVVIDAAGIWLGHHTTVLAKLGDNTKAAQLATWFIILISLAVNFYHGYVEGGYAGGLVGIIFPFVAALLFEFYIKHTIRETRRARGEILPRKPVFIKSRKYGDKSRVEKIQRDFVSLSYETAEARIQELRHSLNPVAIQQDTEIDLPLQDETAQQHSETEPVSDETNNETSSLANEIDGVFAAQMLRDINETMTIKEIIEVLVSQGIRDYDTAETALKQVKGNVSRGTVRTTMRRVLQDSDTGKAGK